jgi:SSS family solute:Na+ symporter
MSKFSFDSGLNITTVLSLSDWMIFFIIYLLTFAISYFAYKKSKKEHCSSIVSHLLMGRKLTLPFFVATLVATWYGGIFGVTQIAFNEGIYNFVTQGFFWYLSYLLFAFFIVDKARKYTALTLPDLIGEMFGPKSQRLATVFNFFNVLPIAYTISLGFFIQLFIPLELWQAMIIGMGSVLLYSNIGGFRVIVYSDVLQFFIMCTSVLLVIVFSWYYFGGFNFLIKSLPKYYFKFSGQNSMAETLVWGFIALSTLVDPNFYQRVFAAKNDKTAKKGILISTAIWIVFDLCTTFGAMYAKAIIPEAKSGEAYMLYAVQILPSPLKGFFLAGILATILSTLDSYLFLSGSTISYDLLGVTKKRSKHFLSIFGVGILSIFLALIFKGNIKNVWKTLGSFSASCFLVPVLFGYIFKDRIGDKQFVASTLTGASALALWKLSGASIMGFTIDPFYIGLAFTSFGLFIYTRAFSKQILRRNINE